MYVLSADQRRFILDLYLEGRQTQAEIAELTGTTQSNVSKIVARARLRDPAIPMRQRNARPTSAKEKVFAASQIGSSFLPLNMDFL